MAIYHILLIKYKPETTEEQKEMVRHEIANLKSVIPHIKELITGEAVATPLDKGYDEGAIFIFETPEALELYRPHQAHVNYQQATMPFIADKLIFDISTP